MPGPSPSCKDYEGGPITKDDADNIINRINERRNFIASGASGLPQSANMNKIVRKLLSVYTNPHSLQYSRTSFAFYQILSKLVKQWEFNLTVWTFDISKFSEIESKPWNVRVYRFYLKS